MNGGREGALIWEATEGRKGGRREREGGEVRKEREGRGELWGEGGKKEGDAKGEWVKEEKKERGRRDAEGEK